MTAAMTLLSQGNNQREQLNRKEHEELLDQIKKHKAQMIELIKFDSVLSRDQNIEFGRVSSLCDIETFKV